MANTDYQGALQRRLGLIDSMGTQALNNARTMATAPSGPSYSGSSYNGGNGPNSGFIDFGRQLQRMGFRVSENPYFGGVTPGVHVRNSDHYRGRAYDVNYGPGGSSRIEAQHINAILALIRQHGFRYLWQQPGHYNHIHVYY